MPGEGESTADELLTYAEPHDPALRQWVIRTVEKLSGQPRLRRVYEEVRARTSYADPPNPHAFFGAALERLGVTLEVEPRAMAQVPTSGPLVFIANHPFGVLDGLGLCELALRARGDMKVMIHRALFRDPPLQDLMLPIDFSGSREAAKRNISVREDALRYLNGGGTVAVFPAGGISTAPTPFGVATDLEWKLLPAKLIQRSKATVIPVRFHGQNSPLFHLVSRFSQTLRMSLVIREVENKCGRPLRATIGAPITFDAIAHLKNRRDLTEHLRREVYGLDPAPFNGQS